MAIDDNTAGRDARGREAESHSEEAPLSGVIERC